MNVVQGHSHGYTSAERGRLYRAAPPEPRLEEPPERLEKVLLNISIFKEQSLQKVSETELRAKRSKIVRKTARTRVGSYGGIFLEEEKGRGHGH
jgi:hypothetical protein